MRLAADWRLVAVAGGAAGLAASPFLSVGDDWVRPVLCLALATAVLVERERARGLTVGLIALSAAIAGLMVGNARLEALDGAALESRPGEVSLDGFALGAARQSGPVVRFPFDTPGGKVLVEARAGEVPEAKTGIGLAVGGKLVRPPEWLRDDLEADGIRMILRADSVEANGLSRSGASGWIDGLRRKAESALERGVPADEAALSKGFVLGDESEIDASTTEEFRRSGLGHLLAVSGQNIVLLSLLAAPLLSMLGIGPGTRLLAIAVLILIYIPLAGGGPSIQRAGVMGLAGLAAVAAIRAPSRVYALGLAVVVTLALNPRASGEIGWQLSFSAVAGIMLLARPLQERLERMLGDRGWRRMLCEGIAVTIAATLATAPLTAFHFERFPIATLPANLLAMPAVAPAMWLAMISIAVGQVDPGLAAPFNLAGSAFLNWIGQVATWFGEPDWAVVETGHLDLAWLAVSALVTGALAVFTLRLWPATGPPVRPRQWAPPLLVILLLLVLVVPDLVGGGRRELGEPPPGGVRVEVLDIGQGDATLIRPAGGDPLLIDGGPPDGDLAGGLESAGVERLSAVLLTHPDLDHYGGLFDLFGSFEVERYLFDRSPPALTSTARRSGAKLMRVAAGSTIRLGTASLEILWPPANGQPVPASGSETGSNLRAVVALLRWRGFRMLMTADAEAESVPLHPGPLDVLRVPHHGSKDTGLPALLAETDPRLAVISVGEDNSYGHPVPEVLAALGQAAVPVARTDLDGTISIVLGADGENWRVETGR